MTTPSILDILKNTDIYLIDQILKNRYVQGEIINIGSGKIISVKKLIPVQKERIKVQMQRYSLNSLANLIFMII